jgi:hypothetical protein
MRVFVFALALTVSNALPALASCDAGGLLSYGDVTYVKVVQDSLVGQQHPSYTYEGAYYRFGQNGPHANVSLDARRATKIRGTFVAVKPMAAFTAIVAVLRGDDFFKMRLRPTKALYLDGPEDSVTVSACGMTTTLSTNPDLGGDEMDLNDAQAEAFFRLEADLRSAIFAQQWEAPPPQQ